MHLIVGLGNPGKKYEKTRHNVGFVALDAVARASTVGELRDKFSGLFGRGEAFGGHPVALLAPQTFMNLSGDSVQPAQAFLKVPPSQVVVLHDELDLPFGEVRLKVGGGHAGHNGLRSLLGRLGTAEFVRVRIGIGRPPADFEGDVAPFVLQAFSANEQAALPSVVERAVDAVRRVVVDGVAAAMNALHAAEKAPRKGAAPPKGR